MAKFKEGDIVILKSNSKHKMTIEKQNEDQTYKCVWQNVKTNKKEFDDYAEILLEKWNNPVGNIFLK